MRITFPKNDQKYFWTRHSKQKLVQYGLSVNKIKRIIRYPDRKEEGIAPRTIAVMQRRNRRQPKKGEIWVLYQIHGSRKKIISAWIYPAITPRRKEIFVPDEVWDEIARLAGSKNEEAKKSESR
jgi:hypothetical protein